MIVAPRVAVACAWYNRADYIRDTLDSLLAQDLEHFEIVVVNDGSPDPRVREILDSYDDPRLQVVHQSNTGFTTAIRRAIDASSAPFIAIQGAGDVSYPARLRLQWEALQANPEAAIAGCHYAVHNLLDDTRQQVVPRTPKRGDVRFVGLSHGELMYRRDVYQQVRGYRPIFTVGQGADLWMRLLRDHDAVVVPEALYEQRYFPDGVAVSPEKVAGRNIMNGVRIENELTFRATGIDHVDLYGPAAFSILGRRPISRRSLILAKSSYQYQLSGRRQIRMQPLEWSLEARIATRVFIRRLKRKYGQFMQRWKA